MAIKPEKPIYISIVFDKQKAVAHIYTKTDENINIDRVSVIPSRFAVSTHPSYATIMRRYICNRYGHVYT